MKTLKIFILAILLGLMSSCNGFLDVENYAGLPADEVINSVDNAQSALNGVYSALWGEYLYYFAYYYYTDVSSGELVSLKVDEEIRPFESFAYYDSYKHFEGYWKNLYTIISRANDVCTKIYKLRETGKVDHAELDKMIGECNFLRGLAYFYLVRSYGDKLPSNPDYNPNGLGVPIVDTLITSRDQLKKPRNTLEETWNEVIRNFETAYKLLPESWPEAKLGAARKGAAAAYLGHVYMYMKDYDTAKAWFQRTIDDPNYTLVEDYAWNFDAFHENNSESVFEVQAQSTLDYTTVTSYLWRRLGPDNVAGGFGMVAVPNAWVEKFSNGVLLTHEIYDNLMVELSLEWVDGLQTGEKKPTMNDVVMYYLLKAYEPLMSDEGVEANSSNEFLNLIVDWNALGETINAKLQELKIRGDVFAQNNWGTADNSYVQSILNESALGDDPRKYTSFFCPGRDSVALDWAATEIVDYPNAYYGFKKYIPWNAPSTWTEEQLPYAEGFNSINQRIYRLADVYLQYSEACYRTGDMDNAVKYLNKVRRRAWGEPFDDASLAKNFEYDYPTEMDSDDFIEVIVCERERELSLEGHVWFDYLRLNWLTDKEGFKETYEARGFDASRHLRFPIPLTERQIIGMDVLQQNSGY